jgi:hypothetical protein
MHKGPERELQICAVVVSVLVGNKNTRFVTVSVSRRCHICKSRDSFTYRLYTGRNIGAQAQEVV